MSLPESPRAPAVTAIVSTYRSARFMAGCLEDLVGQTLFARGELEIVVIDSGSPENEGDIVRAFQAQHPGIRYLRTEREGLYAAWNRAVGLATGRYLTSANTDDRHRADALEILAGYLDAHPGVALAYADCLITGRENETFATTAATERFDWPPYRYSTLQDRCIVGPQPVWRRELHARYGLFDAQFQAAGDYELWLRIGRHETFAKVPEVLGLYLQNDKGLEHGSGRTDRETLEIRRRYPPPCALAACSTPLGGPPGAPASPAGSPAVSVIVTTGQRPRGLARALESLCRQTLRDIEAVVVGDPSQPLDDVLAGFAGRLAITTVPSAGGTRGAARTLGLAAARALYVGFLDEDSCFRPEHLELACETLQRRGGEIAFGGIAVFREAEAPDGSPTLRPLFERSRPFDRQALGTDDAIPLPAVVLSRACLDELAPFNVSPDAEDGRLLDRLADRHSFCRVQQVTVEIVRYDDVSQSAARATKVLAAVRALIADGRPKEALAVLSQALDLASQSADILLALIDVFEADRQPSAAADALVQASVLFPGHPEVCRRLLARA